jgi:flagellar motor switch protein FliG
MSNKNSNTFKNMSQLEKVAYFFIIMGEEQTVKIFEHLPKHIIELVSQQIVQTPTIDKDIGLEVLDEFYILVKSHQYINQGGFDYAKEILLKSMDPIEAQKILDKLASLNKKTKAFSFLGKVDPKQLGNFLKDESPQTIAIVLSHMDASSAAETLNTLNDAKKVQVTLQMATIKDVSPDIIHTISNVLEDKLDLFSSSTIELGGIKVAADMLNRTGSAITKTILDSMQDKDAKVTKSIKENMFVFEDLLTLEDQAIQKIISNIDTPALCKALKNTQADIFEKFTSNMSARAKARFDEELEMITKVKLKEMEEAQRIILDRTQEMLDNGEIVREEFE